MKTETAPAPCSTRTSRSTRLARPRGHALTAAAWATIAGSLMAFAGLAGRPATPVSTIPEATPSATQPAAKPAPEPTQGWFARYAKPGARGAARTGESRGYSPTASFALEPGQGVSPGVPIDAFEASFDATVTIPAAGKYRFGAETEGGGLRVAVFGGSLREPVTLEIPAAGANDARMTRWIDLQAGTVNVQYIFTRTTNAKARLRPMWERQGAGKEGFRAEQIPSSSATPIALGAADVQGYLTAQHGRVLLGELGCISCHAGPGIETVTLARPAPDLGALGERINPEWARKWMVAPQALKPGSGMPGVLLTNETRSADAENITNFLLSTGGAFEHEAVATEPAGIDIGRRAYQTLGCIACHGIPNDKSFKAPQPHTNLAGKWNASALSAFLQDPLKSHTAGRMPSFKLNPQEADVVATYLINAWGKDTLNPGKPTQTDLQKSIAAGRQAFASSGCASCHQLGGKEPVIASTLKAKPLAQLDTKAGCLNPSDQKTPRYTLTAADRAALAAAITQVKGWTLPAPTADKPVFPNDHTHLTLSALGCRNCHEYNGSGGVDPALNALFVTLAETDLGDEGRLPPRLDGVGTKLNSQWLAQVLNEGARARPYMAARMPVFGKDHTEGLVPLLAQHDGIWPGADKQEPKVNDAITQAGRRLVGEKGLNCISCHIVGNNPPIGTPGPDIYAFASRLRYEWWADYIHNPVRFKPGTRMPAFFEAGVSNVSDILSGDPDLQSDAMWAYFTLGEFAPAPEGLIPAGGYKLKVGARPMIMRTFLRDAGSRGIAIGFPDAMGGVHFAFDAERVRLVDAWKGDFLDASGAWAGRGGNVTGGQGSSLWKAPNGPAVVLAAEEPKEWPTTSGREAGMKFRGYRIDDKGVPTLTYSIEAGSGAVEIAERIEPTPDGQIKRTFEIVGVPSGTTVWINPGPNSTPTAVNATTTAGSGANVLAVRPTDAAKPAVVTIVSKP